MSTIAARDLRNHTADVLQRAADGEHVVVTRRGTPVAEIGPVSSTRAPFLRRAELLAALSIVQADAGLRDDLAELVGKTADGLDPLTEPTGFAP